MSSLRFNSMPFRLAKQLRDFLRDFVPVLETETFSEADAELNDIFDIETKAKSDWRKRLSAAYCLRFSLKIRETALRLKEQGADESVHPSIRGPYTRRERF